MRAWLLTFALAACGSDHGRALDLTFTPACGSDHYTVQIATVPPTALSGGGKGTTVTGNELVALFPDATTHADITVTALAGNTPVAGAVLAVDFTGPGEISRAVSFSACDDLGGLDLSTDLAGLDLASSDLASNDLAEPPPDLLGPDFANVDLNGVQLVTGIAIGGSFGPSLYEAEGSTSPTGSGVALLAVGVGLDTVSSITASGGVTVDTPVHSADGRQLAASMHLPVDMTHGASAAPQTVQLTFGSGGSAPTASFTYVPLDELTAAGNLTTNGPPVMFSTVNLASGSTMTLAGPAGPAFLLVTGAFSAGKVTATTTAGGFPGCASGCGAANGPGVGMSGSGGGGAGYATTASGNGGGAAYGDPSVIGLPGGSGGGPGSVAGGNGGASVRILAGSINLAGAISADGASGQSAAGLALGESGGGGGSGGTLLLQSRSTLSLSNVSASGGGGGGGAVAGNSGFSGAAGRIRVDVALPQSIGGTVTPAVGYLGAIISADFPTAQQSAGLSTIEVVCGTSTQVQISVDGVMRGSGTCDALTSSTGRKQITISPPLTADGAIHLVCARSLPASVTFVASPHYSAPYAEDTVCRSLVVVN